jgi:phosphoribosylamine--glycine ligase
VIERLGALGRRFNGVMNSGFFATAEGVKVIEFNARFGDPETQVLMPRLQGDLLETLARTATGDLSGTAVTPDGSSAVTVVLASPGYPDSSDYAGVVVDGLAEAQADGALLFQGGTAVRDGRVVTVGGRILSVTGTGATLPEARANAYRAVDLVSFEGVRFRHDIAAGVDG